MVIYNFISTGLLSGFTSYGKMTLSETSIQGVDNNQVEYYGDFILESPYTIFKICLKSNINGQLVDETKTIANQEIIFNAKMAWPLVNHNSILLFKNFSASSINIALWLEG
jgi:hypothetical protein